MGAPPRSPAPDPSRLATSSGSSIYRVQVLDRALQVLGMLSESDVDLGPADLSARLGLHKSTVHRLLKVLERHELVCRSGSFGRYALGPKLFEFGVRAHARHELQRCAEPHLRRLADATGESTYVSILDDIETVSVARFQGPWTPHRPLTVGKRSPVYCTSSGKAMIAFLPPASLDALLRRLRFVRHTANTHSDRTTLEADLDRIRKRGYAVDDEEIEIGLRCVGGPIRDASGAIVASIGIAGPIDRVTEGRLPAVGSEVIAAARALSRDINRLVRPPDLSHYFRARRSP